MNWLELSIREPGERWRPNWPFLAAIAANCAGWAAVIHFTAGTV